MKLDLQKIKEITVGALFVREVDGVFRFARFTSEQIKAWDRTGFIPGARTSTGISFPLSLTPPSFLSFPLRVVSTKCALTTNSLL